MKFNILDKLKEIFFKKSEYKIEKTEFNISEESKLEKLNIGTCIMDNEEKEKFLSINTPKLVELYEKEISKEDKMLMEKQGLKLDTFVERFKDELKDHDFIEGNCAVFSFEDFFKIELSGYSEVDLNKNQRLIDLLEKKGYIEETIINLKTDIKYYSAESQYQSIEELKNELKLYGELNDFLSKEINKIAGSEIENLEYNAKEYTMKDDLKLKDGSFIKGGTSFFVEGFKNGEFEVHFEARKDNIYIPNDGEGTGYYFSEHEIARYSDLDKTVDLVRGKELINDNMKLDKNNSKDIKDIVEDASKKADDYNNKLEKKEGKVNEKEL
ncbi:MULTISPECIES: hypothetical protein [Bacteria]|uniref:hypothetical protein n=1 Tax=Bacteria TaxID=2 RepID=UPI002A833707|nr:hypothetical protein [Clostridium sp.]MDY4252887.1 hypothetical protein [Clostridium sp.]MDY5306119.1 hypothetical protein [Fusobacterium gastrosuis]